MTVERSVDATLVLIKVIAHGWSFFLQHWDEAASQYQFFGGQLKPAEDPIEAARRELTEELTPSPGGKPLWFDLTLLTPQPIEIEGSSPTYAVHTAYRFWICDAVLRRGRLYVSERERWIGEGDLLSSERTDAQSLRLYQLIDATLPHGIGGVAVTADLARVDGEKPGTDNGDAPGPACV